MGHVLGSKDLIFYDYEIRLCFMKILFIFNISRLNNFGIGNTL